MSDYLTNIIARSYAVEPAIRPRLVSLYEPAAASLPVFDKEVEAHGPAPRQADIGNARTEVPDQSLPLPPPPLRRQTQTRRDQPVFEQETETEDPTPPLTLNDPTPLRVEPRLAPIQETREAFVRPIAESVENDESEPVRQTRVVAESVEIITERRTPASQIEVSQIQTSSITAPPPVAQPVTRGNSEQPNQPSQTKVERFIQRQQRVQPVAAEQNVPARESARPVSEVKPATSSPTRQTPEEKRTTKQVTPIQTRVEREVKTTNVMQTHAPNRATPPPVSFGNLVQPVSVKPAWRVSEREHEESISEPTIQVTIGRVEVRGVVEETKKSQPRQSRLMSLDDYLRRRAQGAKE